MRARRDTLTFGGAQVAAQVSYITGAGFNSPALHIFDCSIHV